ncbi:MAG: Ig-like domain-containing protein [Lachnospiraceae bacterium]|nr:Ig-like domain-containing protein [Lachnospiraceae bacterium]
MKWLKEHVPVDSVRRRLALYLAVLMMLPALVGIQPIQAEAASSLQLVTGGETNQVVTIEKGQNFFAGDLIYYDSTGNYEFVTLSMLSGATYKSSKTSVATIGKSTGKVTAKATGTTTITATYKSKKVTFKLKVLKKGALGTTTTYKSLNEKANLISSAFSSSPTTTIKRAFQVSKKLAKLANADSTLIWVCGYRGDNPVGVSYASDWTTINLNIPLSTRIYTLEMMYNPLATGSANAFQASKMTASVSKNTLTLTLKSKATKEQVTWLREAYEQSSSTKTYYTSGIWDETSGKFYDARVYVTAGSKNLTIKLYSNGKRAKVIKGHKYTCVSPGFMSITASKAK